MKGLSDIPGRSIKSEDKILRTIIVNHDKDIIDTYGLLSYLIFLKTKLNSLRLEPADSYNAIFILIDN